MGVLSLGKYPIVDRMNRLGIIFSMSPRIPGLKPEATISPHPRCVDVFRMKTIIKVSGKIEVGMAGQSIPINGHVNEYPSLSNNEPGHSE